MAGILSIGKGYDPDYLTKSVGKGAENYYLSAIREHGEPPGHWSGKGAQALGLGEGSEVDAKVMEKLYAEFYDIRDTAVFDDQIPDKEKPRLGRRPAKYMSAQDIFEKKLTAEPEATDERKEELRIQSKKEARKSLQFFDLTFSAHKSVTLTHAGLLAMAKREEEAGNAERARAARTAADKVTDALKEAAAVAVEEVRQVASHARVGYHGKKINGVGTGRWAEAGDWVVASFLQHTSRNGDPQLHVHQAVLNRQLCADGKWRSLDGQAIYRARAAASAIAERTLMERLTRELGVRWVPSADGQNFQIDGVSAEQITEFSTRRVEVTTALADLAAAYERKHGYAPNARAMFKLAQQATKDTKTAKPKLNAVPTQDQELADWEARTTRAEIDTLTSIPERALFQVSDEDRRQAADDLADVDMGRVLEMALADCQKEKSTFSRYELTRHISRHLPASFGGLEAAQVRLLLHEMTDEALDPRGGRVLRYTVPDVVAIPDELTHANGQSVFRDPSYERFSTPEQLDAEQRFLRSAAQLDATRVSAEVAALRLGYGPRTAESTDPEHRESTPDSETEQTIQTGHLTPVAASGTDTDMSAPDEPESAPEHETTKHEFAFGLGEDQAEAVYGVLTSGRRIDVLEGYAGTGKSYTVSRLAALWRELTGANVVGLTTAQSAAQVLKDEGLDEAFNIARWIHDGAHLSSGQLVVVDESSMVTTDQMTKIQQAADKVGAKVLLTGDSEQLSAPGAGGLMRQLVAERGSFKLSKVFRFKADWEKDASVRLRAGAEDVLSIYDQHGRLRGGTREEMEQGAVDAYVADHLDGRESLLLTTTNGKAAELAGRVRQALVGYGLVDDTVTATVRGGNVAGVGDLVTARRNDRGIPVMVEGQRRTLTNRDRLRVTDVQYGRMWARLLNEAGGSGPLVELSADYVSRDIELAYSGTVHAGQGRTVDTAHAVVEDGMSRQALYVELSRGREGNWAWVVTETEAADLRPEDTGSGSDTDPSILEQAETTPETPGVEQAATPGMEEVAQAPTKAQQTGAEPTTSAPDTVESETDRDAIGVLAEILETDQADLTATETMRAELDRVTNLAHLGSMWQSLVKDDLANQTSQELKAALPAWAHSKLETDSARGAVITAVRQAVLAGHDLHEVITSATEDSWEGVRSVGQTLSARLEKIVGTGDTTLSSWAQVTPTLDKHEPFVREVAEQMDARTYALGERVAADPPRYLLDRLGEVPEEVMARTEWIQRAGRVQAYREQYGNERDEQIVLGPAPDRHSPEQRMSWFAAAKALGEDATERAISSSRDGVLWVTRAAYARAAQWAPPHMGDGLRATTTERDDRAREAVRLRAQAQAETSEQVRTSLLARAEAAQSLSDAAAARREQLQRVQDQRQEWVKATEQMRREAMLADAELHKRHEGLDLPPLHRLSDEERRKREQDRAPEPESVDPRDQVIDGQESLFGLGQAGPVRRGGLTERPEPEVTEPEREEFFQQELDLGLAEETPVDADDRLLHQALEQAAATKTFLSGLARRQERDAAEAGRDADQEPTVQERSREERYRDDLSRREEAELERRREAQEHQREPKAPTARPAPASRPPQRQDRGIEGPSL